MFLRVIFIMDIKLRSSVLKNIGKRFDKLEVIGFDKATHRYICKCDCGKEIYVRGSRLNAGQKSCSCFSKNVGERLAHGHYKGRWVAAIKDIIRNYKQGAFHRGYEFNLSDDEFSGLIQKPCYYCGLEYSLIWKTTRSLVKEEPFNYNGVDRKDNTKGYTLENCVPCCHQCNYSKCKLHINEWKIWLERISKNLDNF